ncbi:unnamed protein product [Camellia sinensis]
MRKGSSQIEVVKMDYINKRAGKHAVYMEEEDGASGEAGLGEEDGGELNEPARLAGEAVDDGDYSDDSVMGFVAADGRAKQKQFLNLETRNGVLN